MLAANLFFTSPLPLKSTNFASRQLITPCRTVSYRRTFASATPVPDASTVDYSSSTSVFPAEACETVGGEACDAQMFPEVKPVPTKDAKASAAAEDVDREYLEYTEPKTVFPGEACDDLGGEFCEPEYQEGVYKEKAASA